MTDSNWHGKRVLITGVCGTVGRELLTQIQTHNPQEILGVDNNESELFFCDVDYRQHKNINFALGDVRDRDRMIQLMTGIDIVLHSAAFKHVSLCEKSPRDAVQTNILGTQNVIDAAIANNVERVLFTSSDKAVNPTNVMGTSKLMGERLMTAANMQKRGEGPIFASTRFGNVLGSRGSVIPLFKRQIANGGPVTLTDSRMSRFIMTLSEAVSLVLQSTFLACGGEVFVTKMPVMRIADLAEAMVQELAPTAGIGITEIGSKPGEKLYEELMNSEETRRTVELDDYYVVLPAFSSIYNDVQYDYLADKPTSIDAPYNSETQQAMNVEILRQYLVSNQLI